MEEVSFRHKMAGSLASLEDCQDEFLESAVYKIMPPSLRFVSELILDELASNTIKYGGNLDCEIYFSVSYNGAKLCVSMKDNGLPFNPWELSLMAEFEEDFESAEDEEAAIGGRGIGMIRECTDSRKYERVNDKNIITVVRYLKRDGRQIA